MFYLGLLIFFGTHLVSLAQGPRAQLTDRFGENGYKGLYSLSSLVGIVLVSMGYDSGTDFLYDVNVFAYENANGIVTLAFILLIAAYMPGSYIKKYTRHPMSLGVFVWSAFHLSVNPDLKSVLLFGSFLVFVTVSAVLSEQRGKRKEVEPKIVWDIAALVVGMAVAVGAGMFHGSFAGVPLGG
jgi:uncharacterized membrane protein